MDTTYSIPQRPITPPSDRKHSIPQNEFNAYRRHSGEGNTYSNVRRSSSQHSNPFFAAAAATATHGDPTFATDTRKHSIGESPYGNPTIRKNSITDNNYGSLRRSSLGRNSIGNTSTSYPSIGQQAFDSHPLGPNSTSRETYIMQDPLEALGRERLATVSEAYPRHQGTTRQYQTASRQQNDTTRRIEREVLSILQWESPIRSALIFGLLVGSISLSRWFSFLQIGSALLCVTTGLNLFYVNFIRQSQRIVTNKDIAHPYSDVIYNQERTTIDRSRVNHFVDILTELSETAIRALTRIVFIERNSTSLKWTLIFFAIWQLSSITSTMNIILIGAISAFIVPRLYISNKDIVDSQIHKGQNMLHFGLNKAHTAATEAVNHSYTKSRFFVAKVGTTGTDAKNTLQKTSAVLKEE